VGDFESRFREALRRRIYPNAPLHLKEIASAVGRSENTVARWWRGATKIAGDDLYRLTELFVRRGDRRFLHDVFGDLVPESRFSIGDEEAVLALARAVLAKAGDRVRAEPDANTWFTADGAIATATSGHSDYVRRKLGLAANRGDLPAYATRVLGWVGATERWDGVIVVRHDGRHVAPLAAERVCEWLADRADRISSVRRAVLVNGQWIEAHHAGAHAAAEAIAKVALIVRVSRRPWTVARLPLDGITDPLLKQLLRIHRQNPDSLVHAAASIGAFTTSSLFGVEGENVISHHIATGFGFDPSVEGYNVLSRPDTEYALMVQARVLLTRREGPTYHELVGTIDDRHARYFNLAIPEPGPKGRVLTSSVVLELERVAA
jgi:transcriptional regulator with XRE-family HTH domain